MNDSNKRPWRRSYIGYVLYGVSFVVVEVVDGALQARVFVCVFVCLTLSSLHLTDWLSLWYYLSNSIDGRRTEHEFHLIRCKTRSTIGMMHAPSMVGWTVHSLCHITRSRKCDGLVRDTPVRTLHFFFGTIPNFYVYSVFDESFLANYQEYFNFDSFFF